MRIIRNKLLWVESHLRCPKVGVYDQVPSLVGGQETAVWGSYPRVRVLETLWCRFKRQRGICSFGFIEPI